MAGNFHPASRKIFSEDVVSSSTPERCLNRVLLKGWRVGASGVLLLLKHCSYESTTSMTLYTPPVRHASVSSVDAAVLPALPTLRCCCLRSRSRLSFVRCRGISLFSVRKYLFCRHAIVFNTRVSSLSCFSEGGTVRAFHAQGDMSGVLPNSFCQWLHKRHNGKSHSK